MFTDNQLHLLLFLLVAGWCVFHSALVTIPVTEFFSSFMGDAFRFYRLIYNIFSLITLIPVIYIEYGFREELLFAWNEPVLQMIRILLLILCMFLFLYGGKQYDSGEFLGIAQIRGSGTGKTLSGGSKFSSGGILDVIRHPWYLGVIILIWLRNIYDIVLIVNLVFTVYLIIGTVLEERKLKHIFGKEYTEYQKRVSMLLPWKWIIRKVQRKA